MITKFYLFILTIAFCTNSFGQIQDGSTAPDFTFTDIYGNTQNLYSYLNQDKYVAIDVSATWCEPCWDYHNQQVMDSLYKLHDIPGDNTWKIIFVEADGYTDSAALYGLTSNSQGNWVQGSDYTILNPPIGIALNDFLNGYELSYYPTFLLICPNKKVFQTALNGPRPTVAMWEAVAVNSCFPAGIDNVEDKNPVTIYPNPSSSATTMFFMLNNKAVVKLFVMNTVGQIVDEVSYGMLNPGDQSLKYDVAKLQPGVYIFSISCENHRVIQKKVLVQ
jgi:thiol-disulfide isomerase/thioredoxin